MLDFLYKITAILVLSSLLQGKVFAGEVSDRLGQALNGEPVFDSEANGVSDYEVLPEGDISSILYYQNRYPLTDTSKKIVDNHGQGSENLYGVRNFRVVLNGVLYRGGANNTYNKYGRRDNRNPLPSVGLENLCKEGFSKVFYMYSTNYDKSKSLVSCRSERGAQPQKQNLMSYKQMGPWDDKLKHQLLKVVYDTLMDANAGPLYFHCWNGWHASGLISALALRQFCDYTPAQAVKYWDRNTDGNNTAKAYESFRKQIRNFVPYADLKINEEAQRLICLPAE